MNLISASGSNILLHNFPDLQAIASNEKSNLENSSIDFSFLGQQPIFLVLNKKNDVLEFHRFKKDNTESKPFFELLRKFKSETVPTAATCSKIKSSEKFEYAIAHCNGRIQTRRFLVKDQPVIHDFRDACDNCVLSMDYSYCNEYLASVQENGCVNVYGLKSGVKTDTIPLDGHSTLARFHPTRRSNLSVASYKGAITVHDIISKRICFQVKDAHSGPCRDIAMPVMSPHVLLTCGYDSTINVFDTRRKMTGQRIESTSPFNAIAITECGSFFAAGNLKGEIISYDMRSLKRPLANYRASEQISRLAFEPTGGSYEFEAYFQRQSADNAVCDQADISPGRNSSIMDDIIAYQKNRQSDFAINFASRVSSISAVSSRISAVSRFSENFGMQNIQDELNDLSFHSVSSTFDEPKIESQIDDSFINQERLKRRLPGKKEELTRNEKMKRRSSVLPTSPKLAHINEEIASFKENNSAALNVQTSKKPPEEFTRIHTHVTPEESVEEVIDLDNEEYDEKIHQAESVAEGPVQVSQQTSVSFDFKKEFDEMRKDMKYEIQSLAFDLSGRHFEMMMYVYEQRRQLQNRIEMIEDCMALLMEDDPKIHQILRLQEENRELRNKLESILKK